MNETATPQKNNHQIFICNLMKINNIFFENLKIVLGDDFNKIKPYSIENISNILISKNIELLFDLAEKADNQILFDEIINGEIDINQLNQFMNDLKNKKIDFSNTIKD